MIRQPSAWICLLALASGCGENPDPPVTDPLLHDPQQTNYGRSVANIGDFDGDGVPDAFVGASGVDSGGDDLGVIYLLLLNADGSRKSQSQIGFGLGGFGGALRDHDYFGFSVARLGDVDGDGVFDLAVGAPGTNGDGESEGAVWITFLNADGTVKAQQVIGDSLGGFASLLEPGDRFGSAVAALGDMDSDGVPDVAVGASRDDDGGSAFGAVYLLFLNANGTVKSQQKISAVEGGFTGTLEEDDHFGSALALVGDLDSDGTQDLAVGTPLDDTGGSGRGAIWILFLNPGGTVKASQKISDEDGGFIGIISSHDELGSSLGALGDRDADGVPDLVAGTPGDGGNAELGSVWLLYLNTNGTVKSFLQIGKGFGGFKGKLDQLDRFGASVMGLLDVDGDGIQDLGVGAPGDGHSGDAHGAFWVLFLNADGTVRDHAKSRIEN